jgi:HSP20 family protein
MAKRVIQQFYVGPGQSGEMTVGLAWAEHGWQPRVDVYETPDALLLTVEVPGVPDEAMNINFVPGHYPRLIIEGRRGAPECGAARCLQVEIDHGPFRREIRLPRDADGEKIAARRELGLLLITVPRRPPHPPHNVKVSIS